MGCNSSRVSGVDWTPQPHIPGQGPEVERAFNELQLSNEDVRRFYGLFKSIDVDGSNSIDLPEFFAFFKQERTPFNERVFSIMDKDKSMTVTFDEFVVSLWNYLSFDLQSLVWFAFQLYDTDESGYLDWAEVKALVSDVYGSGFKTNHRIQRILDVVDANGDGQISWREFQDFNRRYPMILFPAFTMQQDLRRRVFGESYWKRKSKSRKGMGDWAQSVINLLSSLDKQTYKARMNDMLVAEAQNNEWSHANAGYGNVDSGAGAGAGVPSRSQSVREQPVTGSKQQIPRAGTFHNNRAQPPGTLVPQRLDSGGDTIEHYGATYGNVDGRARTHMRVDTNDQLQGFDMSQLNVYEDGVDAQAVTRKKKRKHKGRSRRNIDARRFS